MDKYKILIVDDEEALRSGLQAYLDLEGYVVSAASSAEEALTFDLKKFDLILLDIMMDGISGIEMAQILKNQPDTSDIPIIFLTAKDSDDDMVSGLNLGAGDYIAKPYSIKNVLALDRDDPKSNAHFVKTLARLFLTNKEFDKGCKELDRLTSSFHAVMEDLEQPQRRGMRR